MLNWFENIHFAHPALLLLLLPAALAFAYALRRRHAAIRLSNLKGIPNTFSWRIRLRKFMPVLRSLTVCVLILAIARPQENIQEEKITADGIDISLVMDLSSSMLAQDFIPDRLEASKQVAGDFISKRKYDRIGLTVFAGEAVTRCPLTTDHQILQQFLANLQCGLVADGTAIGMGLATALNRLKESSAKSKVVILLTDGVNTSGYIKPRTAAAIARALGIKVYTIGIGSLGEALKPVRLDSEGKFEFAMGRVEMDEGLLEEIAQTTGGQYFRATTSENLAEIYEEIDQLEKTEIEVTQIERYGEQFHRLVSMAFFFVLLELGLKYTLLRSIP